MQAPGWTKEDHAALLAAIQKTKLHFAKQKRAYEEDKIDGDEDTRKKQKIMGTEDPPRMSSRVTRMARSKKKIRIHCPPPTCEKRCSPIDWLLILHSNLFI